MTLKKYKWFQIVVMALEIIIMNMAIQSRNWWLAAAVVLVAVGVLERAKGKVKEVIADERDYELAGRASRYTVNILIVCLAMAIFWSMMMAENQPVFKTITSVLSFLMMAILFLNGGVFTVLRINEQRKSGLKGKEIIQLNKGVLMVVGIFVIGIIIGFWVAAGPRQ